MADAYMADDTKQRINLHLSPALLAALDEWRRAERDIPTRSEAVRRLMAQSLKASGRFGSGAPQGAADGPSKSPRKKR
jgi:hypothetical protein